MVEPPILFARALPITISSYFILPASIASIVRRIVIIFVTLAGGRISCAFFSKRIFPVSASIKIADGALTSSDVTSAAYAVVKMSVAHSMHDSILFGIIFIPFIKYYACLFAIIIVFVQKNLSKDGNIRLLKNRNKPRAYD